MFHVLCTLNNLSFRCRVPVITLSFEVHFIHFDYRGSRDHSCIQVMDIGSAA